VLSQQNNQREKLRGVADWITSSFGHSQSRCVLQFRKPHISPSKAHVLLVRPFRESRKRNESESCKAVETPPQVCSRRIRRQQHNNNKNKKRNARFVYFAQSGYSLSYSPFPLAHAIASSIFPLLRALRTFRQHVKERAIPPSSPPSQRVSVSRLDFLW